MSRAPGTTDPDIVATIAAVFGSVVADAPVLASLLDREYRLVFFTRLTADVAARYGVRVRRDMPVRTMLVAPADALSDVSGAAGVAGVDGAEALADAVEGAVDRAFGGETVLDEEYVYGTERDGSPRVVIANWFPVRDVNGDVVLAGAIGVNASRLKMVERSLRRSAARYRALVESTGQDVWLTDRNGNFLEDSQWARLPPAVVEKIMHGDWIEFIDPEDRARVRDTFREAIASGSSYEIEYRAGLATRGPRVLRTRGVPVFDDDEVVEFVGTTVDVTEDRAVEDERRRDYRRALNVALVLQRSMLPASLSPREDLHVVSRYRAGQRGVEVGGDWYDVIPLSGGRTALVVGDVMGRGLQAASVMAQVRAALRSYASLEMDPDDVMVHTCDLVSDLDSEPLVTAVYAVHDPWTETLTWASAGHPSPLIVGPGGGCRVLLEGPDAPLGVAGATYVRHTVPFTEGHLLVLYTDGLLDAGSGGGAGSEGIAADPEGLALWLEGRSGEDPETLAATLMAASLRGGARSDDVALLLSSPRRSWAQGPVGVPVTSEPSSLRSARAACRESLGRLGVGSHLHDDVVLCANELLTNALLHGSHNGHQHPRRCDEPRVRMTLRRTLRTLYVEVEDCSSARPRKRHAGTDAEDGRGLALVEALSGRWGSRPTARGKAVWCGFAL